MPKKELEDICVRLLVETEKAIRVTDGTKFAWFPKSQIEYSKNPDGTYTLTAPIWLLQDKEMI